MASKSNFQLIDVGITAIASLHTIFIFNNVDLNVCYHLWDGHKCTRAKIHTEKWLRELYLVYGWQLHCNKITIKIIY